MPRTGSAPRRPPHPDPAVVDEDLERTELAWDRSGLALAALGVVLLKRLLPLTGSRATEGLIILAMGLALTATVVAYDRHRRHQQLPSRSALKLVATATALVGIIAFVVAVASTA